MTEIMADALRQFPDPPEPSRWRLVRSPWRPAEWELQLRTGSSWIVRAEFIKDEDRALIAAVMLNPEGDEAKL